MMSRVPDKVFLQVLQAVVKENSHLVPPHGEGALYLRPLLFGSGAQLGLAPSAEYTFLIYVAPVGDYFKGNSVLQLARDLSAKGELGGRTVSEQDVVQDDFESATEAFCTGTATVISPIEHISKKDS